jgi:DnaJ-class molecular chaperone
MTKQEALIILGLNASYTIAELKKSYRSLSKKNHPDIVGSGSAKRFIKINEAYELLSDLRTDGAKNQLTHGSIFTIIRSH